MNLPAAPPLQAVHLVSVAAMYIIVHILSDTLSSEPAALSKLAAAPLVIYKLSRIPTHWQCNRVR